MQDKLFNENQAYQMAYYFLSLAYEEYKSDEIAFLLGGMSTLPDGNPADPALHALWLRTVEKIQTGKISTDLDLQ